jgi:hypothetical protein
LLSNSLAASPNNQRPLVITSLEATFLTSQLRGPLRRQQLVKHMKVPFHRGSVGDSAFLEEVPVNIGTRYRPRLSESDLDEFTLSYVAAV